MVYLLERAYVQIGRLLVVLLALPQLRDAVSVATCYVKDAVICSAIVPAREQAAILRLLHDM